MKPLCSHETPRKYRLELVELLYSLAGSRKYAKNIEADLDLQSALVWR